MIGGNYSQTKSDAGDGPSSAFSAMCKGRSPICTATSAPDSQEAPGVSEAAQRRAPGGATWLLKPGGGLHLKEETGHRGILDICSCCPEIGEVAWFRPVLQFRNVLGERLFVHASLSRSAAMRLKTQFVSFDLQVLVMRSHTWLLSGRQ